MKLQLLSTLTLLSLPFLASSDPSPAPAPAPNIAITEANELSNFPDIEPPAPKPEHHPNQLLQSTSNFTNETVATLNMYYDHNGTSFASVLGLRPGLCLFLPFLSTRLTWLKKRGEGEDNYHVHFYYGRTCTGYFHHQNVDCGGKAFDVTTFYSVKAYVPE